MQIPGFQFSHRTASYATHQPVLCEAVLRSTGPVLELGSGEGSTELLHILCEQQQRTLLTLDNDAKWLARYEARFRTERHEFGLVEDWYEALHSEPVSGANWGVVFIDSSPWESRTLALRLLKDRATFVVIHDVDYYPRWGMFGTERSPIRGAHDRGDRDYGDVFTSWREFLPLEPWPYPGTGPPTLLGSNRVRCDFEVDYSRY
jgi:hypothetical protein